MNHITTSVVVLLLFSGINASKLHESLHRLGPEDTVNVWVFFTDKPATLNRPTGSPRALKRREHYNFKEDFSSVSVCSIYIQRVERLGATLRHRFDWENAASFSVSADKLNAIASLSVVREVRPVLSFTKPVESKRLKQKSLGYTGQYHSEMVAVDRAHQYIKKKRGEKPGEGVLVAFFDSGFRLDHNCFKALVEDNRVIATRDFVDGGVDVHDPDSVVNNNEHPYFGSDHHGTQTLSVVAGYEQGQFTGVAYGAEFALARTEDIAVEVRTEEDNWAAAVVWAESLGVDIISSSLGYRDYFCDPDEDYFFEDMDGYTTIVSKAAHHAVRRGVIVVNSMGNSGHSQSGTVIAPADAQGVIAVGALSQSGRIAHFSSSGPTYDGRTKPDLVAPGVGILVPVGYSDNLYSNTGTGTSFSAPIVSGICALIIQNSTNRDVGYIHQRLFSSASFVSGQDSIDNVHGWGMPDALLATMQADEVFLAVFDSADNPVSSALINVHGTVHRTDPSGVVSFSVNESILPVTVDISVYDKKHKEIVIESLPHSSTLELDIPPPPKPYLRTYPTVVKRGQELTIDFYGGQRKFGASHAEIVVRSVDGRFVFGDRIFYHGGGSVGYTYDGRVNGRRVAPGLYYVSVSYGGVRFVDRFLISK
ncbi:S8 family serine peptidase [Chitinispirillales bacterium ANBcel5]|uniref:S8 family serine peptidase n=1 Tax=Cellulosispirillum alkaliphilum TaxID=3039283 RepID=UPI002A560C90|nr:S8 family serine peptidase [Chitinispirillales bacterium ANBcel5]